MWWYLETYVACCVDMLMVHQWWTCAINVQKGGHGVFNTSFQKVPNGDWICPKHLHWKNLKLTYLCVIQMIDHIHGMPRNGPWSEMMTCNMTINDGPTSVLAHLVHNILVNWKTSLKISILWQVNLNININ